MSLQNGKAFRFLHGYIVISGLISCRSGIFIGGAEDTLQIGGVDKSVIRNPLTGEPYIPGSSLKGKLRSITERIVKDENNRPLRADRPGGDKESKVWRHECNDFNDAKTCQLCRIFGSTGRTGANDNYPGALLVRDSALSNKVDLMSDGFPIIETKMENSIDRLTSAAHPRTFERVPASAKFVFELIYRVETLEPESNNTPKVDSERVQIDIANLLNAMDILEKDGLGGNISRGYGKVEFEITEFHSYDINGKVKEKDVFDAKKEGKSLSFCKNKVKDIAFIKGDAK